MVSDGGYAFISGNTFVSNRHAIASDGTVRSGYHAVYNLVLSSGPSYGGDDYQQDFDVHGLGGRECGHHEGGYAGSSVEVARNTFLGDNRYNFSLRGQACGLDTFHDNISLVDEAQAIHWFEYDPYWPFECHFEQSHHGSPYPDWLDVDSTFNHTNPTNLLAVADFDGDGGDDTFLATGQGWYFSPRGKAEWRFLSGKTEEMGSLLFGDFDGDGRADVFTQHGADWLVSWSGISPWRKINEVHELDAHPVNYRIGDFDGDGRADVFFANGTEWKISYGGVGALTTTATSSFRVYHMLFGRFDAGPTTDVFGVANEQWSVVFNGKGEWSGINAKLTDTVDGLVAADFDGDGVFDIASTASVVTNSSSSSWVVSRNARTAFFPLRSATIRIDQTAAIGHFDDDGSTQLRGADVLLWDSNSLDIVSSGVGAQVLQSRQDMR